MDKYSKESKDTIKLFEALNFKNFSTEKPKNDHPDVLVTHESGIYGIEVTSVVSTKDRRIEKEFKTIFSNAKIQLSELGISDIVVRVEPNKNVPINRDRCIKQIVKLCCDQYNELKEHRTELASNPTPEIQKLAAYRKRDVEIIITFDSRSKIYGPLNQKKLKEIIIKKIDKLNRSTNNELSKLTGIWLLIVVEGTWDSNFSEVNNLPITLEIRNPFHRTLVLEQEKSRVTEIKTVYNKC